MRDKYDFSGWATKNNILCADGRTIRQDAFKDQDGQKVPLVWMHQHSDPANILGHAILENRAEGVYAYCSFNNNDLARTAKEAVIHGDVCSLSIYANQLKQRAGDVIHGVIREVSLVVAGANPGACINELSVAHSEDGDESEAEIYNDSDSLELFHAEPEPPPTPKEEPKVADKEKTIQDVFNELTEEQKNVVYFMIGKALEDKGGAGNDDDEDEEDMKHNVFENDTTSNSLSHADYQQIFADAKRLGSLRDAVESHLENGVLAHAVYNTNADGTQGAQQTYGVADINWLFPDYKSLNTPPDFIKRETDWVTAVMGAVHHTPFSRIKSVFANITMDEARAKGYIKGNLKKEEVFSLLKRTTDPQTIYKKQKLDRDDIIDITDFDVVAWIKGEMRLMLDEELARAILIGDGRLTSDDDHISEDHIRPIWTDAPLYSVPVTVTEGINTPKDFIRAAIRARKDYKGSGNPVLYTTEDMLTEMLLLEDDIGHMLYANEAQLATVLRVSKIVTVPVMENKTRSVNGVTHTLAGIIVNLNDYNVGADKGGAVQMFDDFDIDYNQQKYLIETRCSGALIKPYSALVIETIPAGT